MITDDMPKLEELRHHHMYRLHTEGRISAIDVLRFSVWREGGTWTTPRAWSYLRSAGWKTNAKYPLNLAGNMLARMVAEGSMIRVTDGIFEGVPERLEDVLRHGKRAS